MEGDQMRMREALEFVAHMDDSSYTTYDVLVAVQKARAALSAPPRVCDVNTLGSLSDFIEKTILTSDWLKDAHETVKSIVAASVRTALSIAYEPANLGNAVPESRDGCNQQEQGGDK